MSMAPHSTSGVAAPIQHPYAAGAQTSPMLPVQQPSGLPVPQTTPAAIPQLSYRFDGGAATWFGVQLAGALVTLVTIGICLPWAIVMTHRWQAKHTYVNGYRLRFTGDAWSLFGQWIKWLALTIITAGIYSFWVYPRMIKWIIEHQEIDPTTLPR